MRGDFLDLYSNLDAFHTIILDLKAFILISNADRFIRLCGCEMKWEVSKMKKKFHYPGNKKQRTIVCGIRLCALCLAAILLAAFAAAGDYSLEYSEISLDGAQSQTTNYLVVDLLKVEGVDSKPQSSTNYSITTTTGLKDEGATRVDDWMLY